MEESEGGREGRRERGREGEREGGREGGRERRCLNIITFEKYNVTIL